MNIISVQELDQLINEAVKEDKEINKILIGYKLFSHLMKDSEFSEEVINSALSPTQRKYKKLKIKVTTDEYQLHFKSK